MNCGIFSVWLFKFEFRSIFELISWFDWIKILRKLSWKTLDKINFLKRTKSAIWIPYFESEMRENRKREEVSSFSHNFPFGIFEKVFHKKSSVFPRKSRYSNAFIFGSVCMLSVIWIKYLTAKKFFHEKNEFSFESRNFMFSYRKRWVEKVASRLQREWNVRKIKKTLKC